MIDSVSKPCSAIVQSQDTCIQGEIPETVIHLIPNTRSYHGDLVGVSGYLGPNFGAYPLLLFPLPFLFSSMHLLPAPNSFIHSQPEIIYNPFCHLYTLEEAG